MKLLALAAAAVVLLFALVACGQEPKVQSAPAEQQIPAATGDAAVDSVGNGLSSTQSDSEELDPDAMGDLDSGFAEVENI